MSHRNRTLFALMLLLTFTLLSAAQVPDSRPLDVMELNLPPGFHIEVFAQLPIQPRLLLFTPKGLVVSSLFPQVALVDSSGQMTTLISGLNIPHGIALQGNDLYIAEEGQVSVLPNMDPSQIRVVIPGLPTNGQHATRTIVFGPDGKLYVSAGSSCNVCEETDPLRAAISRFNADGSGGEVVARGLRNSVGLRFHPQSGELWATENGFDTLGDELPPDEINIIRAGGNYGWPYCYGNGIPNPLFPPPNDSYCAGTLGPAVPLPAHSAPLGIEFYTGTQFPLEYRNDAIVAIHGSYNRTVPHGYKLVRVHAQNGVPGTMEDFVTGWLAQNPATGAWTASGRPVGIVNGPEGALYVSDDRAALIYRITYDGVVLNANGVTNAASFSTTTPAASNGWITVFGRNIYPAGFQASSFPLPTEISGLVVKLGGQPVPVLSASDTQISALVPAGLSGTQLLEVITDHGRDSIPVNLADMSPGLFSLDSSGTGPGAIVNATSGHVVNADHAAQAGDVIEIFATGLGAVTEAITVGSPAPLDHAIPTIITPSVSIGGSSAEVLFSGLAPGLVGVYQVNVRVPSGLASGRIAVSLTISGQTSNSVLLAVQ